jgi:hypothetical protein
MLSVEQMVKQLVDDDIATIKSAMERDDFEYLSNCLEYGIGYANWTDADVIKEFNTRTWEG